MPSLRTLLHFVAGLFLFLAPARATWSILIIDMATGEVAIGIATCLTNFDLRPNTIVIVPGYGIASAQSFVGPLSLRQTIRAEILAGTPVSQILAMLAAADTNHQSRQYGIVSMQGGAVTFTGTNSGAWAGGVTGQVGSLVYAIQGNVLTGQPVIQAAEAAIQSIPGSVADKLMAAMQTARLLGGDGRCSCSPADATACGSPPASFTKAAHTALMIVSRPGDVDAPCSAGSGCGAGQYWLDLNVANQPATAIDPVLQLQTLFNNWKAQQVGRPDHFQSTVTMSATTLRSNGIDEVTGTIVLRDAQGNALGNALAVSVGLGSGSTVTGVTFGPVTPQANGSYTFTMRGNLDAGSAVAEVAVFDAVGRVGISPRPVVQVGDAFGPCGTGAIAATGGGVFDALKVTGGSAGDRFTQVGFGTPFTVTLDPPQGVSPVPPVGLFALWLHLGLPAPGTELPLGPTQGSLCFTPAPFAVAPTLLFADSLGLGSVFPAGAAPWQVTIPGVPALFDFTLQGLMFVDAQATLAATNALLVRLVPLPAPVITSISPLSPAPGQNVTVLGSNFLPGIVVLLAGNPVASTLVSPTQLTFTMPAGTPCDAVVQLNNPGSAVAQGVVNTSPVITSTLFPTGPAAGGATFAINGQNFGGMTVTIGGVPATILGQNVTTIVCSTPPGTAGPAQVVVRNPNGCQATTTYTYL